MGIGVGVIFLANLDWLFLLKLELVRVRSGSRMFLLPKRKTSQRMLECSSLRKICIEAGALPAVISSLIRGILLPVWSTKLMIYF